LSYYKVLLGVPQRATNAAVRGELGRYPLGIDIVMNKLNYVHHLNQNTEHPLLKEVFSLSKDLGQRNTSSWCNFIKDIAPLLECTYSELMASRKKLKPTQN
jgi:hypothetical protein